MIPMHMAGADAAGSAGGEMPVLLHVERIGMVGTDSSVWIYLMFDLLVMFDLLLGHMAMS